MKNVFRISISLLALLTVLTGVVYPLIVSGLARAFFPARADGSLVRVGGRVIGSELIGQPFSDPAYFWSRPSATPGVPYNATASSGSNLAPTNAALVTVARARIDALRAADPLNLRAVPVDLVTASASGLDPDISPAAALYQVPRVARTRGIDEQKLRDLVLVHVEKRTFGILGEPRVNVLRLNVDLDRLAPRTR
jgi:potassium-transporting ATPase KdpC subunit